MKPMFWKELRQGLKWAFAVLALMTIAAIYFAWGVTSPRMYWPPFERLQQMSVVACPLAGLLLGVLHVVTEKRRDLWAFLVHRPVSRTTIMLAKTSAGLVLYFLAVGIPVAAANAWLALPGNVASPFYGPMVLPGLADVLTGAVYYLAGLLISMRDARWYGSRVLPVGVAVICSVIVVSVLYFWIALLAIIVAAGILGVAAWGSFVGGGQYGPQPPAARTALGASLLAGIATVFVLGGIVLSAIAGAAATAPPTRTSYQITRDGEVVRLVQGRWGRVVEITNLDGTRNTQLEREAQEDDRRYAMFIGFDTVVIPDESEPNLNRVHGYRYAGTFYQHVAWAGPTQWVYSFRERLVLAFDRERKVLVGRLGPTEFKVPPDPPVQRFGEFVATWNSVLAFKDAVYRLRLHKRAIATLIAPAGERVLALTPLRSRQYDVLVVVTDRTVRFMDLDGEELIAADVEHDLGRYGHLQFAATDDPQRFYARYTPSHRPDVLPPPLPGDLFVYGPNGALVERYELPAIPRPRSNAMWDEVLMGLAVPLAAMGTAAVVVAAQGDALFEPDGPVRGQVVIIVMSLAAIACAVVTVRLARRYAFSRGERWGWSAFTFLAGPAGLALLWTLRDWPARLPCAACGTRRVTNRDRCEHCESAFPSPAADGTEIFE
ncbi:MAG: hypothetical protein V3S08_01955 [Phycisphaerales bacterium]